MPFTLDYLNIAVNDVAVFHDGYRQVLGSHTQRALYESTSFVYIWDDHDYGPNNSDSTSPSRTASRLAYRDYVPHYPLPLVPETHRFSKASASAGSKSS